MSSLNILAYIYNNIPIKVIAETICKFSNSENFIVLECVDRLLVKGYNPEDIYLEKRWQLGKRKKVKQI